MYEDLVRRIATLENRLDGLVLPERSPDPISPFLVLPGLVGYWPMSSAQRSTGNAYDLSGQGRTLTYNGNPTYNIYNNLVPYIDFDGTGDYLSRTDETDLDILGTETIFASGVRGLTLGGWFWIDTIAVSGLIGKFTSAGDQRSYGTFLSGGSLVTIFNSTGAVGGNFQVTSTATISTGRWYYVVSKFIPSTSATIFVNETVTINAVAPIASLFNSTSALEIGRSNTVLLDGRASLCFLCANALPDAIISSLFQQTRGLFGV